FNYRTRLTGLARDEATALGLVLAAETPMVAALGLKNAAKRARAKLIESLPDKTRQEAKAASSRFELTRPSSVDDARVRAMAHAVQSQTIVRIRFATPSEQVIHPVKLQADEVSWSVHDDRTGDAVSLADWGRLNVSAKRFQATKS
ncbi:MAG: hypothetical protein AAGK93_11020, partial [Pseudomonadota bacterium]